MRKSTYNSNFSKQHRVIHNADYLHVGLCFVRCFVFTLVDCSEKSEREREKEREINELVKERGINEEMRE